jgi:hypothetical protein
LENLDKVAQWEITPYLVTSIHQALRNWTGCTLNIIEFIGMNSRFAKILKKGQKQKWLKDSTTLKNLTDKKKNLNLPIFLTQ